MDRRVPVARQQEYPNYYKSRTESLAFTLNQINCVQLQKLFNFVLNY